MSFANLKKKSNLEFLQKILKSRKLMENHVIMGPQCLVWPINGPPPPENQKGKNRIDGPRTYIGTR